MRNVFFQQMSIGHIGIADIQIDVSSRDDIPAILLGLQHIYTTPPYNVYHMQRMGDKPDEFIARYADKTGHIQFAVCPGRGQPGTGNINTFFSVIEKSAYSG